MIPKIIHYCWFGRNPKPKLAKKCIRSWKKYCPDYEIIEWNEDNFDLDAAPLYVRQAYEAKKWGFVTDYVRLWAMTEFGGIYMDTDVEVVKSLDGFLRHEAFSGFESDVYIPTGIMACEKKFPLFTELLRFYDNKPFIKPDGTMDLTTNVKIITNMCLNYGLVLNGTYQEVRGFALYPKDFFCPVDDSTGILRRTKNTTTIHWFAGSWLDKEVKKRKNEAEKLAKMYRRIEIRHIIRKTPNRIVKNVLGEKHYEKLKLFVKGRIKGKK